MILALPSSDSTSSQSRYAKKEEIDAFLYRLEGWRAIYLFFERGEGWRFSPGCRSARIYFSKVLFLLSLPPSPSLARLLFCRIKFTQRNNIFTSTRLPNSLVERAELLYFPCLRCRPLQELSCPVPCSREFEDVKPVMAKLSY